MIARATTAIARAAIVLAIGAAACGEKREREPARTEPIAPGADAGDGTPDGGAATPPDDPDSLGVAGGIPAWQAVIDRDRYLARRGQGAVVVGRLGGEAIAPGARGSIRWLVDETEGNGSLAIRVALPGAVPDPGTRLAVRGAWMVDNQRRWYWQADAVTALGTPAPPGPPDAPAPPGHQVIGAPVPSGYRVVSRARDNGAIVFGVIRAPQAEGEGWLIGDNSFGAPIARLTLPGERASYGGHDLRHDDERWQLKRGVLYWVRIDRVRRRPNDPLATMRAVTAPMKLQ